VDTFWKLLQESTIIQASVTLILVAADCFLWATSKPVPPELLQLTTIVIGFWFGTKAQSAINSTRAITKPK
jgi:hypothetical protein